MATQQVPYYDSLPQDPTTQPPPCPRGSLSQPDSAAPQAAAALSNNSSSSSSVPTREQSQSVPQQHQQQQQHPHLSQQQQEQQQQHRTDHNNHQNPPQANSLTAGPTATAPFLNDFSLVSEAAKRAQIGVMMRDLESVSL